MVAKVSKNTKIVITLHTIIALLIAVATGTAGYFSLTERVNSIDHSFQMMDMDLKKNTEFRIRWPRGELGSLPADSRQDLLITNLQGQIDRIEGRLEKVDDLQVRTKLIEQKLREE